MNKTSKFNLFQNDIKPQEKFCPFCEEELEETMESDKLYCIKCQKTIKLCDAKDDVSIEYIFGNQDKRISAYKEQKTMFDTKAMYYKYKKQKLEQ